jgi:hypothetical protein
MKKTFYFLASLMALALAGCSHSRPETSRHAEWGRGTFVSPNGQVITAVYLDDDTVRLRLPNHTENKLYLTKSGSGIRYTNAVAEWWEHHGEASYYRGGTNVFTGKLAAPRP